MGAPAGGRGLSPQRGPGGTAAGVSCPILSGGRWPSANSRRASLQGKPFLPAPTVWCARARGSEAGPFSAARRGPPAPLTRSASRAPIRREVSAWCCGSPTLGTLGLAPLRPHRPRRGSWRVMAGPTPERFYDARIPAHPGFSRPRETGGSHVLAFPFFQARPPTRGGAGGCGGLFRSFLPKACLFPVFWAPEACLLSCTPWRVLCPQTEPPADPPAHPNIPQHMLCPWGHFRR